MALYRTVTFGESPLSRAEREAIAVASDRIEGLDDRAMVDGNQVVA